MNFKKSLLAGGLILVLICAIPVTQALGAEPYDPSEDKIIGPTMWAVVVVDCSQASNPFYTLRVKKIESCDVDTDPLTGVGTESGISGCPLSEADVLNFEIGNVFNYSCPAIITKVKNYNDSKTTVVSFDAQIKFYVPGTDTREECTPTPPPQP